MWVGRSCGPAFWQEVAGALTYILDYPIPCEASVLLIGIRVKALETQSKTDRRIMWSCLSAAKTTVAFHWRKQTTSPITLWWARLWTILAMEKLTCNTSCEGLDFDAQWGSMVRYMSFGEQSMLRLPRMRALDLSTGEN